MSAMDGLVYQCKMAEYFHLFFNNPAIRENFIQLGFETQLDVGPHGVKELSPYWQLLEISSFREDRLHFL